MEQLIETSHRLDQIKGQLKKEFIGLDEIIDQLIDAVGPWCAMNSIQERPLVVNLWGMTGVGKTSLVLRFLKLWDEKETVIHFNMGSKSYFKELLSSMENMVSLNGNPAVILFDEFQHARTMANSLAEHPEPTDRMIWQLLDDGKFLYSNNWMDVNDLQDLIASMELCLDRKVNRPQQSVDGTCPQSLNVS